MEIHCLGERGEKDILRDGFRSKGGDVNLNDYVNTNKDSVFIRTSKSKDIAEEFASSNGTSGHVYVIDPNGLYGIDVNENIKNNFYER